MTRNEAQAKAERLWGEGAYAISVEKGDTFLRCVVGCTSPDAHGAGDSWEEAFANAIESEYNPAQ